jgi:hypothetical protein
VIYNGTTSFTAGLTIDAAGNIFGISANPQNGYSEVIKLSPNGNGGWNTTVIYTFTAKGGRAPAGTLVLDHAGNLYGTTTSGNAKSGTVYKLSPGKKEWKRKILYTFKGSTPIAGIVFDTAGNIYGTTVNGGTFDYGTVFELAVGEGSYNERTLWSFNFTDGYKPFASLILDGTGNLYGTTLNTVFEVTP